MSVPSSFRAAASALGLSLALTAAAQAEPEHKLLAKGLVNPESAAIGPQGDVYVSVIGEFDKDGDGRIVIVDLEGKAAPRDFAKGLNDPKGIIFVGENLFVTDKTKVLKIDGQGKVSVLADAKAFPSEPKFLNDIVADAQGTLFVTDSNAGAIYSISPEGKVTLVADQTSPAVKGPNGLTFDNDGNLLVLDFGSGNLHRLVDGKFVKLIDGFPGGDGLAVGPDGKIYLSQWSTGDTWVLPRETRGPESLGKFQSAADLCLTSDAKYVVVPDMKAGTVTRIALAGSAAAQLDETPFKSVTMERAFPNVFFDRPIVLTHAGDGSGRVFVATQKGTIFSFPNKQDLTEDDLKVFLDMESKVTYKDSENEEGFLGLAFHPKFKENGHLFVYYTTSDSPHTSVISRFTANKEKTEVDPKSEVELLRIPQPYWNHNGGTIVFGPDGYLYVGLGDGGAARDPHGNGQNMNTLLGKILRIDVDHKEGGKSYAIPKDNPFVGQAGAKPEIYASGLRNVWRMSFDKKTGQGWVADVGQDIWEEIDLLAKGANYGWNPRESKHPFGAKGSGPDPKFAEPIFEYHHDVGKSITGGHVYRGKLVPELGGWYLYADYVGGQVWALKYDFDKKQVVANRPLGVAMPIMSFGEDEDGEVYFMTTQGWLHRFVPAPKSASR